MSEYHASYKQVWNEWQVYFQILQALINVWDQFKVPIPNDRCSDCFLNKSAFELLEFKVIRKGNICKKRAY